jgi:hypothetical protein
MTEAIGLATVAVAAVPATLAGLWSLAGAFTVATLQIGIAVPLILVVSGLARSSETRSAAAVVGLAIGTAAAFSQWRVPVAAVLAISSAAALFAAETATGGDTGRLADERVALPASLLLVLLAATAAVLVGAVVPVLADKSAD